MNPPFAISRRAVLRGAGAIIIGFPLVRLAPALAQAAPAKTVAPDYVDAFLAIDDSGMVTVFSGKVDLGTGVRTALSQIVADELDVAMEQITMIEGDTDLTPDQGVTYGSLSIQIGGMQLRRAAATARAALLQRAAQRLGVSADELTVADGVIKSGAGKEVAYAALIPGGLFELKLDPDAPLKDPRTYRYVGKSLARLDIPVKVTGDFVYTQDFRVPGMLHGRVIRPPAIGATLREVDESSVRDIAGVRVVRVDNFLGVVAEDEWAAITAAQQLKATWSSWDGLPEQSALLEHIRATAIVRDDVTSAVGDIDAGMRQGAKHLKASYDFAIHTHGSIGPSCAVAHLDDGMLTCWSSSQGPHALRRQLAEMLSISEAQIRVIYVEGAGCYGRNGFEDAAGDAALLAREVGRPVRVQWMRADEHGWDPKGPPILIDYDAALDAAGDVLAWSSQFYVPDGGAGAVKLIAADLAGLPHDNANQPGNIINDSAIPYRFPHIRTVAHRLADTPLRPGWIRTPGRLQNTFGNEAFLDELIRTAGADPLDFRLRHLDDPRGAELLRRLRAVAQWQRAAKPPAQSGDVVIGRGLAYVKYELYRTYVGAVADVAVNRKSGEIRVSRFTVVQDCGQIINPDGVRNQIEGNVIQTVSRTLKEQVTFDRSHVTSLDWVSYPILTFPEIPEVVIDLIDRPNEVPWGSGEPSAAVVPAAIANAVFDACGARLRSVPFTPDKLRAALPA
jgi:CO/xanthine dehydrogenase Mo-binding subunit